jgi:uncharacterized protein
MTEPKVTREDVLQASKGMLQKQVYIVLSAPTRGMQAVMENLPAHLEHQCKLERSGVLLAAGPNWTDDEQTWEGDGTFVIRASSLAEAREIAASDPMHKCGARAFRVRPWLINEGGLRLRISFSDGKVEVE